MLGFLKYFNVVFDKVKYYRYKYRPRLTFLTTNKCKIREVRN